MCARAASALLSHVNLLLTLYGGAALATAARLKWDPSAYVPARELLPAEYRAAAGALAAGGAALLLLPHLAAAAAPRAPRPRRLLLYAFATLTALLVLGELLFGVWLARQLAGWLRSDAALRLREALQLREHLRPVLAYLARWYPLPQHLSEIIQEAEEDIPRNIYACIGLGVLLALLQPLSVALALVAARAPAPAPARSSMSLQTRLPPYNGSSYDYQKVPLKTAYKNGRIVILP